MTVTDELFFQEDRLATVNPDDVGASSSANALSVPTSDIPYSSEPAVTDPSATASMVEAPARKSPSAVTTVVNPNGAFVEVVIVCEPVETDEVYNWPKSTVADETLKVKVGCSERD